jgi:ATPase family associated with various cellular activities (AAA)
MNQRILHALFFCPTPEGFWGLPAILHGEPGTGKTSNVKAVSKTTGLPYYRISPAERGEGQFGVVPVPNAHGTLDYPAPAWAHDLENGGILFIDEINTAPPMIQAPLLGLVQLGVLGTHTFNSRVRRIGAANETMDAAGGWDLAPALANRFGHYEFDGLDSSSWVEGLLGGFGSGGEASASAPPDPRVEEARVMAAWPGADAMARGLVGGFIHRRPELLHKRPEKASAKASRAWPSRRSVEYTAVALASANVHGLNEIDTDELLSGFVGQAWVSEFRAWQNNLDLPDPAEVLDGKVAFKHDERRLDRSLALLSACAALVVPDKAANRAVRAGACWRLVNDISTTTSDIAIPAARALVANKILSAVVGDAAWKTTGRPALARLEPILAQAGL